MVNVQVLSGNLQVPAAPLTAEDKDHFDQAWEAFMSVYDMFGKTALSDVLAGYKALYQTAVGMAKSAFKGAAFGGANFNLGFNMQEIRAVTMRTQSSASLVYDFDQNISATGWAALFGSQSAPFNTGINSTLGPQSPAYTNNNVFTFITHLYSISPPLFNEFQFGIGTTTYAVQVARFKQVSDVYITQLANPIVLPLNTNWWMMANFRRLGTESTAPLGTALVTSAYAALR